MFNTKEINLLWERVQELNKEQEKIRLEITDLKKSPTNLQLSDIKSTLDELILWRATIMDMATQKTPQGKIRLSRTGKRIFGNVN